ncbi:hypothetical protein [Chitinophaga barathri]|uniref:Uncharacterized protein n=1 Tax=Chitinophaga barathri TaxID=1647451 RepID=A0A3N4MUH9_9BACT|nr:hypothetical protein [Chitinophaga barathri]RPD39103.1 hypothetical protein EG028_21045 [Chitinophaga barathri]
MKQLQKLSASQSHLIEDREKLESILQHCIDKLKGTNTAITGVFITLHLKTGETACENGLMPFLHTDTSVPATVFNNITFLLKPLTREPA